MMGLMQVQRTLRLLPISLVQILFTRSKYELMTLIGIHFQKLPPPVFHISREQIRAYYHGWVLRKGSVWKDEIGRHILLCAQVTDLLLILLILSSFIQFGLDLKPKLSLFSRLKDDKTRDSRLEVLGLQYLILPFTLLGSGLGLAFLVFMAERSARNTRNSQQNVSK